MNREYFNNKIDFCIDECFKIDKNTALESILKTVFESLLKAERNYFLSECDTPNNKGNGYYQRLIKSISTYCELRIPRDRLGLFHPFLLEILKHNDEQINNLAFQLYVKGLSTRDIEDVINKIYDKKISPSKISSLTKEFETIRKSWEQRKLNENYYFIYIDAIQINIRRRTVEKEAFYIVLGVKEDLTREVLGVYNIPTESASGWSDVFEDIKKRGLKKCLMFISDELPGLSERIREHFPKSIIQSCIVHKKRNILKRVRSSDKKEIANDLNEIFELENDNFNVSEGNSRIEKFLSKWEKVYPKLSNSLLTINIENYFGYTYFPSKIQRMIYTTNWIERLNKSIRRTEKLRNSFPSCDSALNLIVAYIMEIESKTYKYPITSMFKVKEILENMIDDYGLRKSY